MTKYLTVQAEYELRVRRISGSRDEKLEQIDAAIQELLDIKALECASDNPGVRFLAVPRPRSHAVAMTLTIVLLLVLLVLLLGVHPARAQETAAVPQWTAGAFIDAGYLKDFNSPGNRLFRGRGTTPRVDELDVDMASVYFAKAATADSRWGVQLAAQDGKDADAFGFSPTAPHLAGANWLRRLGPTNVSYRIPAGRGLTIQSGIFNSLIGYDSLYAKDNFAYTRPWGADFTPYFMMGANAMYPATDRLTVTGFVVNGYFHLAHANDAPSAGGQIACALGASTSLKQTVMVGSHQANTSPAYWRVLSDTIIERKAGRLTVAGEVQSATERVELTGLRASWFAGQLPVHVAIKGPWSATARPEFARDASGRYTGARQNVIAITSGLEYRRPLGELQAIARAEYRYDRSTGPEGGFFSGDANALAPGQPLLALAMILTFDHTHRAAR